MCLTTMGDGTAIGQPLGAGVIKRFGGGVIIDGHVLHQCRVELVKPNLQTVFAFGDVDEFEFTNFANLVGEFDALVELAIHGEVHAEPRVHVLFVGVRFVCRGDGQRAGVTDEIHANTGW